MLKIYWCGRLYYPVWWLNEWGHPDIFTPSLQIWEVYNDRRCVRTYSGHKQAVRDITFNNSGTEFLSCGYDRYIKLWDTETGKEISKIFTFWLPACLKISYSIILILLLSIDFLTGLNIWIYIYFIEMVWKCIMVHIYHREKFSTSIYSVKKCQENILLIFMILLNRSVNSLF